MSFGHSCLLSDLEIDYNNLSVTGAFPKEEIEVALNKFDGMIKENGK
jgi:hypothetical protein